MDTLIHADIFFFVTTIAVVLIGVVFIVALIYLIIVLRDIKRITREVREEVSLFREDIRDLRANIRSEGFQLKHIITAAFGFLKRRVTRSTKTKK